MSWPMLNSMDRAAGVSAVSEKRDSAHRNERNAGEVISSFVILSSLTQRSVLTMGVG